MPSLLTGVSSYVTNNYLKSVRANGLGPRTLIVKLAGSNLTNDNVNAVIAYLTTAHGDGGEGDSAFTVAGFSAAGGGAFESGVTDTVYLALQGTGDFNAGVADQGIGSLTVSVEAIFDQNYQ